MNTQPLFSSLEIPEYINEYDYVEYAGMYEDMIPSSYQDEPEKELVDHPEHYNPGTYEAINVIEAYNLGFHLGNAVKYILRAGKKHDNVAEDIDKAIWYLSRFKSTQL